MMIKPALAEGLAGGQDTIVAVATPPGRGAIAVIRMSGTKAFEIAGTYVDPWPIEVRTVCLCKVCDRKAGKVIDRALVTRFMAPDSFTGEDIVEISSHGGQYVPATVMAALISSGARLALPGEFTRRAVLNGKLDIVQAEAIADLIDARSEAMLRTAIRQLDGGLSRRIVSLRNSVIALESLIAYDIDFPEEDDGPISRERIVESTSELVSALDDLLATIPAGEIVRDGAVVVIAGEPNAGKSSLFNALLGHSRAIVTDIPGTTRDAIEGFVETANWPLRLVDTAGLRETTDTVERFGIEVSERYLAGAHVILACGETADSIERVLIFLRGKSIAPKIRVRTKVDLDHDRTEKLPNGPDPPKWDIDASAETGQGLVQLLSVVDEVLTSTTGVLGAESPVLIRSRHVRGIKRARDELTLFSEAWQGSNLPAPVAAVHLRAVAGSLEELIGAVSTDDVLDHLFSSFCVGK